MRKTKKQLEAEISNLNEALSFALGASPETDANFFTGGLSSSYTDRNTWDRRKIFTESLRAWRVNPMARRLVRIKTSYVVGKAIEIKSDDPQTQAFLQEWWNHPLNKFKKQVRRWKDEDTRTGNLFMLYTVQANGMTTVRAVPAEQIEEIETAPNDIEQETKFITDADGEGYDPYDPDSEQAQFMLHFASNQPVGTPWGEPELAPLIPWIGRFASWLEDRVRLNRFRSAFMYIVMMTGADVTPAKKLKRQAEINANPPKPGSVLVTDPSEQWGIISASLDSFDANTDGLAIKKMIAGGFGSPLHWLAEPESSTRTTAEAAGTPTFRTLEEEQYDFFDMLTSMARVACEVRARYEKTVKPNAKIWIEGNDITERDNALMAMALQRAFFPMAEMYDRELIDEQELMTQAYKMMGETWSGGKPKGKRRPLTENRPATQSEPDPVDPDDPKEE